MHMCTRAQTRWIYNDVADAIVHEYIAHIRATTLPSLIQAHRFHKTRIKNRRRWKRAGALATAKSVGAVDQSTVEVADAAKVRRS